MNEWRPIPSTNGAYEASSAGEIRRRGMSTVRKQTPREDGYVRICLSLNGKLSNTYVHILVAEAFLGPRPAEMDTNHKNGVKSDNRPENLEYLTRKDHEKHTREVLGRNRGPAGEDHGNALLTEEAVRAIHSDYCSGQYSQLELAERHGVSLPCVNGILNGHTWRHLGLSKPPKRDYRLRGLDNPKGKVSPQMKAEARTLYAQGLSGHEIAKQLGLGSTTIYRVLKLP
jgi:hypothetical protein